MSYVGDIRHHRKSDDGSICLYDQEGWPCHDVRVKEQVIALVLEIVQPTGAEPVCCDTCADRHAVQDGLVDEIKEL